VIDKDASEKSSLCANFILDAQRRAPYVFLQLVKAEGKVITSWAERLAGGFASYR